MPAIAVIIAVAITLTQTPVGTLSTTDCSAQALTTCSIGDGGLDLGGWQTTPGEPGSGGGPGDVAEPGAGTSAPVFVPRPPGVQCFRIGCDAPNEPDEPDAPAPAPAVDPITIHDLASFAPAPGELVIQPDGWGIEGKATNVYVTSSEQTQNGELFDSPITVRWNPITATFNYGDGTTITTTNTGQAWNTGEELDTTNTSHVYENVGTYTVTATVEFTADVLINGTWITVPGTLTVTPNPQTVQIYRVDTVLVRGNCIQYPEDPGCPDWEPPDNP